MSRGNYSSAIFEKTDVLRVRITFHKSHLMGLLSFLHLLLFCKLHVGLQNQSIKFTDIGNLLYLLSTFLIHEVDEMEAILKVHG